MNVKIEKKGDVETLVITLPVAPAPSKSGKSTVIASTHGNQPTTAQYNGKAIVVGVNAYVK